MRGLSKCCTIVFIATAARLFKARALSHDVLYTQLGTCSTSLLIIAKTKVSACIVSEQSLCPNNIPLQASKDRDNGQILWISGGK
jgi:hypothetical protein